MMDVDILKECVKPYRLAEVSEGDYDGIWEIYTSVGSYFRRFQPFPSSKEEAIADLDTLPHNAELEKKHSFALYDGYKLVALLDFIEDYPMGDMIWLGLLLVHRDYQNRGIGGRLLRSLESAALAGGCHRLLVAVAENNLSGRLFWQAKGFVSAGVTTRRRPDGFTARYLILEKSAVPAV